MSEKTHWKKVVSDPNFIGEADFQDGEEKIVTIKSVNKNETVVTAEGKSQKAVVHFAESGVKPMILNVARSKSIEKVSGSAYFEDWPGVKIQLYIEKGIKAFGDIVNAVRVRNFKPRIAVCADTGKEIKATDKMTTQQIIAATTKKYGRPLCAERWMELAKQEESTNATDEQ